MRMMLYIGQINFSHVFIFADHLVKKQSSQVKNCHGKVFMCLPSEPPQCQPLCLSLFSSSLLLLLLVFQVTPFIQALGTHCWKLMPNGWCCHYLWRKVFSIRLCAIQSWRFLPLQENPGDPNISKVLASVPKVGLYSTPGSIHHTVKRNTANMQI